MSTPHVHKDVIIAWANGLALQYKRAGCWVDIGYPTFDEDHEYRVKPERVFPDSTLTDDDLKALWLPFEEGESGGMNVLKMTANAAIKQYILDTERAK